MASHIVLARVGAGKTEAAQSRLLEVKRAKPLAKVWVLLSTERQISDFRRRLSVENQRVLFNIEFFTFYPLYNRILTLGASPQRCLDNTARYGLLREILRGLPLNVYKGIAQTPGFIRIVAALIYELKQNLITPQAFELGAANAKERELAQIYDAYQTVLREHDLVDREGEGWLALDALGNNRRLASDVELLIVDGYDQFNFLQARLLSELGTRAKETLITLTTAEGREQTTGRRFARALERLRETHDAARLSESFIPQTGIGRDPALLHLADQLLRPVPHPYSESTSALRLLEAPDPTAEAAMILRRIKRLLLNGVHADDVLIAVRDWTAYADPFMAAARAYGVPVSVNYGESLATNPAITALMNLLDLHKGDFRRRDLMDALRSPYFKIPGVSADLIDALERAAYDAMINAGRSAWLEAVDLLAIPASDPDEDGEESRTIPSFDAEIVAAFRAALVMFFDAITPPETGSAHEYIAWLEGLIGYDAPDPDEDADDSPAVPAYTLNIPIAIRELPDERFTQLMERDLGALGEFKNLLRALLSASFLLTALKMNALPVSTTSMQPHPPTLSTTSMQPHPPTLSTTSMQPHPPTPSPEKRRGGVITAAEFLRELRISVEGAAFQRGRAREGRVLITSVSDARGLPHDHVFIPGMSEGLFPAPTSEDPLLLDSERRRLDLEYGIRLPTQAERADDEGLFYELIGLARETLTLSRPCYKKGEAWSESHLYRAVRVVFPLIKVDSLRIGAAITADDVATRGEAAITAVTSAPALRSWLANTHADFWRHVERGLRVERGRLSRSPHDQYTGRLVDKMLIDLVADKLSDSYPPYPWSATQLAEFGVCSFRFFASRLLKLEPFETLEEGMDQRQLGTLQHEILEKTYHEIGGRGLIIQSEHADEALAILKGVAGEVLHYAPIKLRFRPSALWEKEKEIVLRRLIQLVKLDFSSDSPISKKFPGERHTHQQETEFSNVSLDLDGEHIQIRGVIDRMDRIGDRIVIIDYKSGSTKIPKEETEKGRNFQMMVYLSAAQQLVEDVAGGMFWHVSDRKTSGDLSPDDPIIDAGKAHIRNMLVMGRNGLFFAKANGMEESKCTRYCDFAQFCRVSVTNQGKVDHAAD